MSHIAKIKVEIKDLDALKSIAKKLGLEFVEGQKSYRWYGRSMGDAPLPEGFTKDDLGKCDHALRIPQSVQDYRQPYEIGVVKRKDGKSGYELLWDYWNGGYGLTDKIGQKGEKLIQGYAVEVATRSAIKQGFRVCGTVTRKDGKVELTVMK